MERNSKQSSVAPSSPFRHSTTTLPDIENPCVTYGRATKSKYVCESYNVLITMYEYITETPLTSFLALYSKYGNKVCRVRI